MALSASAAPAELEALEREESPSFAGEPTDYQARPSFAGELTGHTTRVSVYPGRGAGAGERPEYDRSAVAGAGDELFAKPGVVVAKSVGAGGMHYGTGEETLEEDEEYEDLGEIEDNNKVYETDSYQDWECHYLRRVAKRIHRLVCAQLDHRSEEALFMLFIDHDRDMDGVIKGEEASRVLDAIQQATPNSINDKDSLVASDGSISFVALLNWYGGKSGGEYKDTSAGFNVTSLTVGLLGSGMMQSDGRLEKMDWVGLRRNVLGYRKLLKQLRELQQERALRPARVLETDEGLLAAMPRYYAVLSKEFEGDDEHLFELFCEVDVDCNMSLETKEVMALMKRLDKEASDEDVERYIKELCMDDGPLTFSGFADWWNQALSVSNSLVAIKGAGLIAGFRAEALREKVGNMFFETAVQKQWTRANQANKLPALRQAYCRTFDEIRDYKIKKALADLEAECAHL